MGTISQCMENYCYFLFRTVFTCQWKWKLSKSKRDYWHLRTIHRQWYTLSPPKYKCNKHSFICKFSILERDIRSLAGRPSTHSSHCRLLSWLNVVSKRHCFQTSGLGNRQSRKSWGYKGGCNARQVWGISETSVNTQKTDEKRAGVWGTGVVRIHGPASQTWCFFQSQERTECSTQGDKAHMGVCRA